MTKIGLLDNCGKFAGSFGGITGMTTVFFCLFIRNQKIQKNCTVGFATRKALRVKQDVCFFSQPWRLSVLSWLPEASANVQRDQVRLRSFRRKGRFEEGRACGFVFWLFLLHLGTTSWFLITPCFSGLSPAQVWLKYLVTAGSTPWLLWQQLIYK